MNNNILDVDLKIYETLTAREPPELDPIKEEYTIWFKSILERPVQSLPTYEFYLIETLEILREYEEELRRPMVINFYKKSNPSKKEDAMRGITERFHYILSLLGLSIQTDQEKRTHAVIKCCVSPNFSLEDNDFFYCCISCGARFELDNITSNYGDCNRLAIAHKNPHDKRNHFSECIDTFQGIQKSELSEDILRRIEEQLRIYGLEDCGAPAFSRVKKDHIRHVLKELGIFKKHKEDINVIYKIITGKTLPQINHLKSRLLDDFDMFDERYNQLFPKTDQSAYHYYLILYQLLCFYNFPCNKLDFNFLKTAERKFMHEQKYKQVFESLGWNYQSLF